jgi:hypothetical protein
MVQFVALAATESANDQDNGVTNTIYVFAPAAVSNLQRSIAAWTKILLPAPYEKHLFRGSQPADILIK